MDGTHLNMQKEGCVLFDWGVDSTGFILKTRCTYFLKENLWTNSTFYTIPGHYKYSEKDWVFFCEDRNVKMFIIKVSSNESR